MTNAYQKMSDHKRDKIAITTLSEIIELIASQLAPEEVFNPEDLIEWAENNGYGEKDLEEWAKQNGYYKD